METEYSQLTIDILTAIRRVPSGKVASYGAVAAAAGHPRGARLVVRVLHTLSKKEGLPWHRIVNVKGEIALSGSGEMEQILLLKREGVRFVSENRVEKSYFYDFK